MKYSILQNRSHENNDADKHRSIFRRINILDVFLVLVLLGILFLLATFFFDISILGIGDDEREISYVVEIDNVSPDTLALVKKGDLVYEASGKDISGFVIDINASDSVRYMYNESSKTIEKVTLPVDEDGKTPQTLLVTVRAVADYEEGSGYSVGGTRIVAGNNIELCFRGYTCVGECVSVTPLATEEGGN